MNGKIELIIGPMFAGKSTELLRQIKRYQHAKKNCLIVSYIQGIRQADEDYIVTHDQFAFQLKATQVEKLEELSEIYKNYDVIAIDEGQFFSDIDFYCELFANQGKIVLVAALNSTFQRKEFGRIGSLMPICESVTKLTSICAYCSQSASFTKRIIDSNEIQLIGGSDMYRPQNKPITGQFGEKEEGNKLAQMQLQLLENNNLVNQKLSD